MLPSCKHALFVILLLALAFVFLIPHSNAEPYLELDPNRVHEIQSYLPAQPAGLGEPITDRTFWTDPVIVARCSGTAERADSLLDKPLPAWNDEAYLEFSRVGLRPGGEKMLKERFGCLVPLVLAECLKNNGRYVGKINEALQAYCDDPTWTLPAHDGSLTNFHRTKYDVDLNASSFGHDLAEALYLLGDKVHPTVRTHVMAALQQRIFDPFLAAINKPGAKTCWWLKAQMNWNAVCLAGSVGAAVTVIPDQPLRAVFVAAGEHYSKNYPHSFSKDGYDTEGVGYWGYGFGHYIILRSNLLKTTDGKIELFLDPQAAAMALFGARCRIGDKAVAPFADCRFGTTPNIDLLVYANDAMNLGLNLPHYADLKPSGELVNYMMQAVPVKNSTGANEITMDPLRTFFADVGILLCRPTNNSTCHLGIGLKAGGNGNHSHNDIGSYEIAINDDEPEGDPGGPIAYNSSTFGPKRYTYKILNSFGHPVPVIDNQLQIEAAKAHPKVLSTSFQNDTDSISIDMTSAYAVSDLKSLVRSMTYSRSGLGQIEITDQFECKQTIPLEEGLVTHGTWKQLDATTLEFAIGAAKLKAVITVDGGFAVKSEEVEELGAKFTRIGLTFKKPSESTQMKMVFTPE